MAGTGRGIRNLMVRYGAHLAEPCCSLRHLRRTLFPATLLYAEPGRIFTASDGTKLNFYCMGSGTPTVVFEAGEGDWSPCLGKRAAGRAQWTRTCSYDRSGQGFSGLGPLPTNDRRSAEELHSALRDGGVRGPYILVGHATGGDIHAPSLTSICKT